MRGDELNVVIIEQVRIFVRQAEGGCRLRADDFISLPHGVG
jgi:hypothetical protein